MPLLVWGGGAIGGCVAAWLARAGLPVNLVDADAAHVQAIASNGLTIEGPVEQFVQRLPAWQPAQVRGTFELILLAVKAQATDAAVEQLKPHLGPGGTLVSLQNGLNEVRIARRLGESRTVAGFVNFAADCVGPGRIDLGNRGALVVGEMKPGLTPRVQAIAQLLQHFDPRAHAVADIWPYKWGKLAYGSLLFATALAPETMAQTLSDAEHRAVLVALAREVIGVARALEVEPLGFDGFEPSAFTADAPEGAAERSLLRMADHYRHSSKQRSGVWRDLAVRRRKTEVDTQIAEIVHLARSCGRTAPLTQALIRLIQAVERGEREIHRRNLLEFAQCLREPLPSP